MRTPATYLRSRKRYDLAIALILASISVWINWQIDPAVSKEIATRLLTMSATLFGFVLASSVFIFGQIKSGGFELLQKSKQFSELRDLLVSCFYRTFYLMLVMGAIQFSNNVDGKILVFLEVFLFAMVVLAIWALISVVSTFVKA